MLIRLYRTAIQVPRERATFERQEEIILGAISAFQIDHDSNPAQLFDIVPNYLSMPSLENDNGSFQYRLGEDGNFVLSSEIPTRWFGWPIRRVCRSGPNKNISCSYYFVCGLGRRGQYLIELPSPNNWPKNLFVVNQMNPCVPSE